MHIALKKTAAGKYRICLIGDNGKLVLQGEPQRLNTAVEEANKLRDAYNDKRQQMRVFPLEVLPVTHKWPKNSGPKPKKKK